MSKTEENRKYANLRLDTAEDVRELIRTVIEEIVNEGSQVENAGRICNLLQVWLRASEQSKLEEIEQRLAKLEQPGLEVVDARY
jgi:predicted transcriptional regulator